MSNTGVETELRVAVRDRDFGRVVDLLEALKPADRNPDLEGLILDLLWNAPDHSVRNATAIALADLGSRNADSQITKLLRDERTKGARGTLLYALSEMGCSLDLSLVTDLLISDTPETQEECVRVIAAGRITFDGDSAI